MDAKHRLAHAIVSEWHDESAADAAAAEWTRVVSQHNAPAEIPAHEIDFGDADTVTVALPALIADAGAAPSRGAAKRLLQQGAIQLNGERTEQQQLELREGDILKVGRRHWLRIQRTGSASNAATPRQPLTNPDQFLTAPDHLTTTLPL